MVLKESSKDTLDCQKDEQVGPEQHPKRQNDKTEAVLLEVQHEKVGFFRKGHNNGEIRRQQKKRKTSY